MNLSDYLAQRLEETGISESEFQELIIRLVNYSVIVRDESQTEQQLFDRLVRCRELVEEYLAVIGIQIHMDTRFEYVRVYPPSSEIPGIKEADENAWSGSLRNRLSQYEVALVLVLRAQYEKALREGKIDEKGYALDSIESLIIAAKNLLGRNLPEKLTERKKLFQRLRLLRLIDFRSDEAFDTGEGWIKIHPMIVTFVSDTAVDALASESNSETEVEEIDGEKLGMEELATSEKSCNEKTVISERQDLPEGEMNVS
ncbi:DUF4194 domain-containing protein [Aliikangiella coralliicola]|uniref:DUF4194 domain-containing protein n=1 Tax=Aliikangiella coralliicola TaxID=2592383 RepID=A0A545UBR4_9GAMM|nr:DUF4194 domain-containing protein [Aliikangiella coralliicola]TQV86911.1 DUF4194 domain-containing protein [Aliikangiella coralliicola]